MVGLLVADAEAAASIGAVPGQTGVSIAVVRVQAGIGIAGLPVPGDQMTGRHSIMRKVPWTAGPEAIIIPAAASGPMVTTMAMAAVVLALVLTQTFVDSAVVIVAIAVMTIPSALLPGADQLMGLLQ